MYLLLTALIFQVWGRSVVSFRLGRCANPCPSWAEVRTPPCLATEYSICNSGFMVWSAISLLRTYMVDSYIVDCDKPGRSTSCPHYSHLCVAQTEGQQNCIVFAISVAPFSSRTAASLVSLVWLCVWHFATTSRDELHLLSTFCRLIAFGDRVSIVAQKTTVTATFPSRSQGPAAYREPA